MSSIGMNSPDNPFSARGRVNGQSADQLKARGLDSQGHPAPADNTAGQRPSRPSGQRNQSIAQLAQSIGSMELANQDDLHAFCEAIRAIMNYLAVSTKLAEGQLKAAARANARQSQGSRWNVAQTAEIARVLRQVGRDLDQVARSSVNGAAAATKAWRRFETLLDSLENDGGGSRPGGRRGGFQVT